jgi:hypothetical protein
MSKVVQSELAGPSISNKFKSVSSANKCDQAISKISQSEQKKMELDNSDLALNSILHSDLSDGNLDLKMHHL